MEFFVLLTTVLICAILMKLMCKRPEKLKPDGLALFITGCDSGIGRRLAEHFAHLGCDVFAGCLKPEEARKVLPRVVRIVPLDVTSEESVAKAEELVKASLSSERKDLWALVNNAGVCVCGHFEWQTWQQSEQQVAVNLLGTMRVIRKFLPLLRPAKGRLITVTSVNGRIAYPGLGVYSATKFALEGLQDSLRIELRRLHGVRVITVRPGDLARTTAIMAGHRGRVAEMWEAMSGPDKERWGPYFHRYHELTLNHYGLSSPSTLEGAPIIRDMTEAVLSRDPASKYVSAPIIHRLVYWLLSMAPASWTDFLLNKAVDVMERKATPQVSDGPMVGATEL